MQSMEPVLFQLAGDGGLPGSQKAGADAVGDRPQPQVYGRKQDLLRAALMALLATSFSSNCEGSTPVDRDRLWDMWSSTGKPLS